MKLIYKEYENIGHDNTITCHYIPLKGLFVQTYNIFIDDINYYIR